MPLIAILVLCLALFGGYTLLDEVRPSPQNVEAQGLPAGYVDCGDGTLRRSCDVQPRQQARATSEQDSRAERSSAPRRQVENDAGDAAPRQRDEDEAAINCKARKHDYLGTSPTLSIDAGELMVVDFYYHGEPQQVTILPEGAWQPYDGILVGSTWTYPNCPDDAVEREAGAHAGGGLQSPGDGFSGG